MSSTITDIGRTIITMRRAPRAARFASGSDTWLDVIRATVIGVVLFFAAWTPGEVRAFGTSSSSHVGALPGGVQLWLLLTTPFGAVGVAVVGAALLLLVSCFVRGLQEPLSRTSAFASLLPGIGVPVSNAIALEVLHVIAGWMRAGEPLALAIRRTTSSFAGFPIARRLEAALSTSPEATYMLSGFLERAGLAKTFWTTRFLPTLDAEGPVDVSEVEECYPETFEREPNVFAMHVLTMCGTFALVLYFLVWGPAQYAFATMR